MKGNKIAEELGCSTSLVSTYISDFKVREKANAARRDACSYRRNSTKYDEQQKCAMHVTCDTCELAKKPRWRKRQ